MLNLIVCMKQVPQVSELPWDSRTGTLKREIADGMMNPACRHALEGALQLKENLGGHVTVITMGPPMAQEILHEAIAVGADRGILLTDRRMAGADTLITSYVLAEAIRKECPSFDLILCGCSTSDSETAQVGPQLAEELDIAGAAYVEYLEIRGRTVRMERESDDFMEILEMELPGLVTVTPGRFPHRYPSFGGLQDAFDDVDVRILNVDDLGLDVGKIGMKGSPTRILNVYSPTDTKENLVLKGSPKKIVETVFDRFGDRLIGAMGKDLKTHDHGEEEDEQA